MKKRILCIVLACILTVTFLPAYALAAQTTTEETVTYYEDGSYMVSVVETVQSRASGTVTHTKSDTYYSSNNVAQWYIRLIGTFDYNGVIATCTNSTCQVTIHNTNNWYLISKNATKSRNTASCAVTFGIQTEGVTVSRPTYNLSISCDVNGNKI